MFFIYLQILMSAALFQEFVMLANALILLEVIFASVHVAL